MAEVIEENFVKCEIEQNITSENEGSQPKVDITQVAETKVENKDIILQSENNDNNSIAIKLEDNNEVIEKPEANSEAILEGNSHVKIELAPNADNITTKPQEENRQLESNEIPKVESEEVVKDPPQVDANDVNLNIAGKIPPVSEREKELLDMVFTLESEKQTLIEQTKSKLNQIRKELEETKAENEKLQKIKSQLEQNLKQAVTGNVDNSPKSKKEFDDVLVQAKTLLFEKTKECKHKEQHIETLKCQVGAVKEVLNVTKEMLNLRNIEMEHLQSRLEEMAELIKAEREKSALVEKKLTISQKVYEDLKREYNFQTQVFKELKETYEQKIDVLNKTIEKLK